MAQEEDHASLGFHSNFFFRTRATEQASECVCLCVLKFLIFSFHFVAIEMK